MARKSFFSRCTEVLFFRRVNCRLNDVTKSSNTSSRNRCRPFGFMHACDHIYTSTPLHAHHHTCLCTHEHTSGPLHARATDIYPYIRPMYEWAPTRTHQGHMHLCTRVPMSVPLHARHICIYTLFICKHTSVHLHARHTQLHTHVRVSPYTHAPLIHICTRA